MKKIGILTFHSAINNGAVLQAFALYTKIKDFGFNPHILNYVAPSIRDFYDPNSHVGVKQKIYDLLVNKNVNISKRKFASFLNENLRMTSAINELNNNSVSDFSLIICGSDQVWNSDLTGSDNNYAFSNVDDIPKASYAASFGHHHLTEEEKTMVQNDVSRFVKITVRESSAKNNINKIIDNDVNVVPDPVFLLDSQEWRDYLSIKANKSFDKYILLFVLHKNKKIFEFAKKLSREKKLPVYMISNDPLFHKGVKKIKGCGPKDFLEYIYNASYVITDSFHASSFSIIFNKQLFIFLKEGNLKSFNARLEHLVSTYGLQQNVINNSGSINKNTDFTNINKEISIQKLLGLNELKIILDFAK